jgi:large subunit ribosomal protein L9
MQVLLLKDVRGFGQAGDLKKVADGYARNYLLPHGLAVPATESARKALAEQTASTARHAISQKTRAEERAVDLRDVVLTFTARAGESGRLYGSITSGDIAERLSQVAGVEIDKRKVMLDEPIKELGQTSIDVRLHANVTTAITVKVVPEE